MVVVVQAQRAVGEMGMPVLATVLKDDRDDIELVRGTLEVLNLAMTPVHGADMHGPTAEVRVRVRVRAGEGSR
eukprot:366555-Chlamydomonas_euryale.AAC.12